MLLAPAKRRLTDAALERLSSILADAAQVAIASVAIPSLLDRGNGALVVWGLLAAIVAWSSSVVIAQQIR